MKCSCKKAKEYLKHNYPEGVDDYLVQVKCRRCHRWVGQEAIGYPLPRDISQMKGIYSITFRKP